MPPDEGSRQVPMLPDEGSRLVLMLPDAVLGKCRWFPMTCSASANGARWPARHLSMDPNGLLG